MNLATLVALGGLAIAVGAYRHYRLKVFEQIRTKPPASSRRFLPSFSIDPAQLTPEGRQAYQRLKQAYAAVWVLLGLIVIAWSLG